MSQESAGAETAARSRILGRVGPVSVALALGVAVLLALGGALLLDGDDRPAPDAFYAPPATVPGAPGALLRAESLPAAAPAGTEAWRILYTTTRPDGSPTVASGTVLAPAERGARELPLLTVAHGTTGIASKCAPSLTTAPFANGAEAAVLEMVAEHGWAAVSTDYPGIGTAGGHPYLVGEAEARSVLDASRAAARLDSLRIGSKTVVWGYSQGGHAALWAGQVATAYAPDLAIEGIAALAPVTDLHALARADSTGIGGTTVSAYIATAWNDAYPRLDLAERLAPDVADDVERVSELCFNQKDAIAALLRDGQIFPDSLLDGELGSLLRQNAPTGPWPAPVLVAQGTTDPLVTPAMQDGWVAARCAEGRAIDYRKFEDRGHTELVAADSPLDPQLVDWTLDRWRGEPDSPTCGAG